MPSVYAIPGLTHIMMCFRCVILTSHLWGSSVNDLQWLYNIQASCVEGSHWREETIKPSFEREWGVFVSNLASVGPKVCFILWLKIWQNPQDAISILVSTYKVLTSLLLLLLHYQPFGYIFVQKQRVVLVFCGLSCSYGVSFCALCPQVFAIFAFASTGDYSSTTSFNIQCQGPARIHEINISFEYPFRWMLLNIITFCTAH